MNPQIAALHELQKQDRLLVRLERRLELIPKRLSELEDDLGKLESMLETERAKCDEARAFQKSQEDQLAHEEEMIRNAKARMAQVKTARELNATQREMEATRRMASSRTAEIAKIQEGVAEKEQQIAAMNDSLVGLRAQADEEKKRLLAQQSKAEAKAEVLRNKRKTLTDQVEQGTLRTYERIRKRGGGIAFVPAKDQRCSACKMVVSHMRYVELKKGNDIMACESCGRLLFWAGHFPDEDAEADHGPKPKAAPPKVRKT